MQAPSTSPPLSHCVSAKPQTWIVVHGTDTGGRLGGRLQFELSRAGGCSPQGKPDWTDVLLGSSGRLMLQPYRSHKRSSPVAPLIVSQRSIIECRNNEHAGADQ